MDELERTLRQELKRRGISASRYAAPDDHVSLGFTPSDAERFLNAIVKPPAHLDDFGRHIVGQSSEPWEFDAFAGPERDDLAELGGDAFRLDVVVTIPISHLPEVLHRLGVEDPS